MKEENAQSKQSESPKTEISKVDVGQIYKETFISQTAKTIAGFVLFIPVVAIWVVFFYFGIKTGWLMSLSSTMRGVVVILVLFAPALIASVSVTFLARIIESRFRK